MEKATSRSVAFSSFKITANFNIVTRCRSMCIRVQISAGFSITHILQEVPTNFHSVLIICDFRAEHSSGQFIKTQNQQ